MDRKVALITGGARGLGRAFVEILLEQGASVCIFDIHKENGSLAENDAKRRYSPSRVFFFHGDAVSQNDVQAAMEQTISRFGGLDILCNNAGILNEFDWAKAIEINLTSMVQNSLLGLRHMGKISGRPRGVIINVASLSGVLPQPQLPIYSCTKHGVVGFSRALGAISQSLYDIRVNCLCPSFTDTPMIKMSPEEHPEIMFDGTEHLIVSFTKMQEKIGVMRPRDVAECFMRLVKDESLSGEAMLATPEAKGIMKLGTRMEDAIALCKI